MNVELHHRAVLIKIDSVMDLTGRCADEIYELVDGPSLLAPGFRFVFNVATEPNGIRDLRFWTREVIAPEQTAKISFDRAISIILPEKRSQYPAGEVAHLLHVRRPTLMRLRAQLAGRLESTGSFFPRSGLESFLRSRCVGVSQEVFA